MSVHLIIVQKEQLKEMIAIAFLQQLKAPVFNQKTNSVLEAGFGTLKFVIVPWAATLSENVQPASNGIFLSAIALMLALLFNAKNTSLQMLRTIVNVFLQNQMCLFVALFLNAHLTELGIPMYALALNRNYSTFKALRIESFPNHFFPKSY